MSFSFKEPINPEKPLDRSDPPPEGWETVDAHDYSKAFWGFPPDTIVQCREWEERELSRLNKK